MRKIHCEEVQKKGFDKTTFDELREMIGWIEPPEKKETKWGVTLIEGYFDCETHEIALLVSSIEEVKALLLKR